MHYRRWLRGGLKSWIMEEWEIAWPRTRCIICAAGVHPSWIFCCATSSSSDNRWANWYLKQWCHLPNRESKHRKRVFCKSTPLSCQGQPFNETSMPQKFKVSSMRKPSSSSTKYAKLRACRKVIYYQDFSSEYRDSSPVPFTGLNFVQRRLLLTASYDGRIHLFNTPTLTRPHNIPIVPFTSLLENTSDDLPFY